MIMICRETSRFVLFKKKNYKKGFPSNLSRLFYKYFAIDLEKSFCCSLVDFLKSTAKSYLKELRDDNYIIIINA